MSGRPGDAMDAYPATLSATVGLAAILGACFAGSTGPMQSAPLLLETVGLTLFAGGVVLRRRTYRFTGSVLAVLGFVVAVSALVGAVALSPPLLTLLPAVSCGIGMALVTLGVFPLSTRVTRPFVIVGIALVFGGVLANAVIADPSLWRSAVAVTLAFLSWDASERAITLGEQVGSAAETISVEVLGTAASSAVAVLAVVSTIAVSRIPVASPSLVGLALLLVATLAFVLAFAHVPDVPKSWR